MKEIKRLKSTHQSVMLTGNSKIHDIGVGGFIASCLFQWQILMIYLNL